MQPGKAFKGKEEIPDEKIVAKLKEAIEEENLKAKNIFIFIDESEKYEKTINENDDPLNTVSKKRTFVPIDPTLQNKLDFDKKGFSLGRNILL